MNNVTFPLGSQPVVITNDDEARSIILRLGLQNQLSDERRLPDGKAGAMMYSMHGHVTHWVVVGYFHGFARAEENGYMVKAWDKTQHPASVMDDEMAAYSAQPLAGPMSDLPRARERDN